ncbi:hypothetical protein [Haematobacter genomosp. 1]|uniref:Uncharacterized protein n=1 Tax=Haematobacter genomosp. 1 TaxID=366618 RepID=A0A212ABQ1_9RHOB|nr:hypothetical protein [Haematobacter genomosp. 1]OWJ78143.1 hypothetical protein CDV49_09260 [Haematobacter genomosp. 1]
MSFPKKGKFFPNENGYAEDGQHLAENWFADEIASALKRFLGNSRAGAKVVPSWTGANEKTVKNWFAGRFGPSGEHLVALESHSDEVLGVFLAMAGRQGLMVGLKLAAAEQAIEELLAAVRRLPTDDRNNPSHDETDFTARK